MHPHSSQVSHENVTQSSNTSPLAYFQNIPPPPLCPSTQGVRVQAGQKSSRQESNGPMQSKFEMESEQFFTRSLRPTLLIMAQTLTPSKFEMESECCFPQIVKSPVGVGVLLGILGRDVPPCSPSTDPISDQKMSFFTLVFQTTTMQNTYPLGWHQHEFHTITSSRYHSLGNI